MQHSIAAKYAARPVARFVRPSHRARQRRLGLRASAGFQAVTASAIVVRRADLGPLVSLRARWRSVRPAAPRRSRMGRPRPAVTMQWSWAARSRSDRPSSAAPAPWRA